MGQFLPKNKHEIIPHKNPSTKPIPTTLSDEQLYEKFKKAEEASEETKEHVLRLFGEFNSFENIKHQIGIIRGTSNPFYDTKMIEMFCSLSKNKLRISHHRNKYLVKLKDVAISNKRIRIDDLQYLRDRFIHQIKNLKDDDVEQIREFRYMAKGLSEILSQAQDEIEGKGINIHLNMLDMGDMDDKSDAELISRRQELLAKAERAISGGTQRRGIAGDSGDSKNVIETTASEPA
jgi:hypothetical protein